MLVLSALVGLAWEMLPFLLFSTEKIFSNLCIKSTNCWNTTRFYIGVICAVVSLQLYIKCFYYKIELMYKILLYAIINILVLTVYVFGDFLKLKIAWNFYFKNKWLV